MTLVKPETHNDNKKMIKDHFFVLHYDDVYNRENREKNVIP